VLWSRGSERINLGEVLCWNDGTTANPDLTPEQIKDAYDEWVDSGKPARK